MYNCIPSKKAWCQWYQTLFNNPVTTLVKPCDALSWWLANYLALGFFTQSYFLGGVLQSELSHLAFSTGPAADGSGCGIVNVWTWWRLGGPLSHIAVMQQFLSVADVSCTVWESSGNSQSGPGKHNVEMWRLVELSWGINGLCVCSDRCEHLRAKKTVFAIKPSQTPAKEVTFMRGPHYYYIVPVGSLYTIATVYVRDKGSRQYPDPEQ